MEERKWEELKIDLLVEIFTRVGIKSLSQCIPFVCKPWYSATLVLKCWERLVFPFPDPYCSDEFVKSVVDRSQGAATYIELYYLSEQILVYMSEKCPALKKLFMWPDDFYLYGSLISCLICKWKNLEFLRIGSTEYFVHILESINIHCKNFVALKCPYSFILEEYSDAIVEFLPKIKYLNMECSTLTRKGLVKILKGCRELEFLDVSYCFGFDCHDTEILELASHIPSFKCNGATLDGTHEIYL